MGVSPSLRQHSTKQNGKQEPIEKKMKYLLEKPQISISYIPSG